MNLSQEPAAFAALEHSRHPVSLLPSQRALIVATFPEVAAPSLLPDPPPEDPAARLDAVTEVLASQVVEHEPELRAQLRLSLEAGEGEPPELPFRTGRAIAWIEDALAPLRGQMPERELRQLVLAIRCAVGIETLVWLTDIAGISREEAADLMCWSARSLLRSALAEHAAADSSAA